MNNPLYEQSLRSVAGMLDRMIDYMRVEKITVCCLSYLRVSRGSGRVFVFEKRFSGVKYGSDAIVRAHFDFYRQGPVTITRLDTGEEITAEEWAAIPELAVSAVAQ